MKSLIKNDILKVEVNSLGAELNSIMSLKDSTEYLWQGNPEYWAKQSPVLFPIIGNVENKKYTYEGQEYELNGHGFARDYDFTLVESKDNYLCYKLLYNEDTLKRYPFKFELYLSYTLKDNNVTTTYTVKNIDNKDLFFSLGAHPAFNCPITSDTKMEDYYLEFSEKETIERNFVLNGLRTGEKELFLNNESIVPLSYELFYKYAISLKGLKSNIITMKCKKNSRYVAVRFDGFPYMGIWSPENDAPFVCIEPWYGVTSLKGGSKDIKEKEGINLLPEGETFECQYTISIG